MIMYLKAFKTTQKHIKLRNNKHFESVGDSIALGY